MRIALVETKPSRTDFNKYFELEFDRYCLCSDQYIKKPLKKDIDIDININDYDWIILVGADAFKYFTKNSSVTDYSGKVVDKKFLPVINPAMLDFKPEAKPLWESSRESILKYISGELKDVDYLDGNFIGITDEEEALRYIQDAIDHPNPFVALDSETTGFYPRNAYVLGISLSYKKDHGAYISSDCITERVEKLAQKLWNKKLVIFQNAKFDRGMLTYHFGWTFPRYEDTMLIHYMLDENPGGHGLKELALKFTKYGDYEKPLHEFIDNYRKVHGILKEDFTFDLIPFDIIKIYAACDAVVTFLIYIKLKPALEKNKNLLKVYNEILIPGSSFLEDIQYNGVPFDLERLKKAQKMMDTDIQGSIDELYKNPKIKEFEEFQGKEFNPNSTQQLRKLLFDFLGLKPIEKRTTTGAYSTDAEVLALLAEQSNVPELILNIRKKSKIKNTYLDKIIPQLDSDSRLRTNFNLHSTTSGRLSSSGKLNMQQLPRDNPAVKGCIKAQPGYKIISIDLKTAEVYEAAVLSKDKELMKVFTMKGDFHSTIAKLVFNLDCPVEEVKARFPLLRQAAKAITFGILYQAGPGKIAQTITKESEIFCSEEQAKGYIDDYFSRFKTLKKWIDNQKSYILANGYCYSYFGRKRRLPNVNSSDRAIKGHAVRSGINFLIQSVASDVNLLAGIQMNNFIKENKLKSRIFALVHDSILAEVPEDEIDLYVKTLTSFIEEDRGISIPGCSIGCDVEIYDDYSMGKYEKYERKWDESMV